MTVQVRRDGQAATISIDNAARLNCLGRAQIAAFIEAVTALADDPDLRVLVVTGEGDRAFMGGANLHELAELDPPKSRDFLTSIHRMCKVLRDLPVPVIARVNGFCLGGGMPGADQHDLVRHNVRVRYGREHFSAFPGRSLRHVEGSSR